MLFYVAKRKGESNERLAARMKKLFFGSRIHKDLKENRYAVKKASKRQLREKAIASNMYLKANDEL